MPGRKGLAPAVGSRFIHGVLEAVGDAFRDEKRPAELKRALEIPVAQSQPPGRGRYDVLQNIACCFDSIPRVSFDASGKAQYKRRHPPPGVNAGLLSLRSMP